MQDRMQEYCVLHGCYNQIDENKTHLILTVFSTIILAFINLFRLKFI